MAHGVDGQKTLLYGIKCLMKVHKVHSLTEDVYNYV